MLLCTYADCWSRILTLGRALLGGSPNHQYLKTRVLRSVLAALLGEAMTALGNGQDCRSLAGVRVADGDGLVFVVVVAHHRLCENVEGSA